jgi:branched-chain amino acid aminotransferase
MSECFGENFILNGELVPAVKFDNSLVYDGESLYEVIRIVNGNPLFFHDHMERLANSARLQVKDLLAEEPELRNAIQFLIQSEKKPDTNLKIVFNYNESRNYLVYLLESSYPTQDQYLSGVKGILYRAERKDPESKVINQKLRSDIAAKLMDEGAYEAILVNGRNEITEGSRSNIFFLKDETLVTAPDDTVLNGITRKHILDICREKNLTVEFKCVKVGAIGEYDGAFMTGTSPIVLPFFCIDEQSYSINYQFTEKLRMLYLEKADDSILLF